MLATAAEAQFTCNWNPAYQNKLVSGFPTTTSLGNYICSYSGTGTHAFTGMEISILQTKSNGNIDTNYAPVCCPSVVITYRSAGTTVTETYYAVLVPAGGGIKKVSVTFMSPIGTDDSMLNVAIVAKLLDGIDTLCRKMRCAATVHGTVSGSTVYTSPSDTGQITFTESPLVFTPAQTADRIIPNLPTFSQIVGTFVMKANYDLMITQFNIQSSGQINGYLPEFLYPRVVDSAGNDMGVAVPGGMSTASIAAVPVHMMSGERRKIFVLSDIISASFADYIRTEISGIGYVNGVEEIPTTVFQSSRFSPLGERAVYKGPATVNAVGNFETATYPNPVIDKFTIHCRGEWSATLSDVTGKVIKNFSGVNGHEFNRDEILSGFYILTVKNEQSIKTEKIIFQ